MLSSGLRNSLTMLRLRPGVTAVAVLTLALGIGANTAVFSVIDAMVLRPLPYAESENLVVPLMSNRETGFEWRSTAYPDYLDWRQQEDLFEQAAVFFQWGFDLTSGGEPEKISALVVSEDYFPLMRARPLVGRVLQSDDFEPGAGKVVVLSQNLWNRRFGGRQEVMGDTVLLSDVPYTVVGIFDPSASFPSTPEMWIPYDVGHPLPDNLRRRDNYSGRLSAGLATNRCKAAGSSERLRGSQMRIIPSSTECSARRHGRDSDTFRAGRKILTALLLLVATAGAADTSWHLALESRISGLDQLRYYGLGNETANDQADEVYRIALYQLTFFPAVAFSRGVKGRFLAGPVLKYSDSTRTDADTVLSEERSIGFGTYGQVGVQVEGRCDSGFDQHAFDAGCEMRAKAALYPAWWDVEQDFGYVDGEIGVNIPLSERLFLSIYSGGRKIWGDGFPFFEAAYIGGHHTTAGYNWSRFGGDASLRYCRCEARRSQSSQDRPRRARRGSRCGCRPRMARGRVVLEVAPLVRCRDLLRPVPPNRRLRSRRGQESGEDVLHVPGTSVVPAVLGIGLGGRTFA